MITSITQWPKSKNNQNSNDWQQEKEYTQLYRIQAKHAAEAIHLIGSNYGIYLFIFKDGWRRKRCRPNMIRGVIPDNGARKCNTKFTYVSCDTWQVVLSFSAWSSIVLMYIWI